jgi:hypothetical protein
MGNLNDDQALEFLRTRVDPSGVTADRHRLEKAWTDHVAWYCGLQHYARAQDGHLRLPREHTRSRGRLRHVVNLIKPNILRNVSRMLELDVTFDVLPRNGDIKNLLAAEVGRKYFQWRRQSPEYQAAMLEVILWTAICGTGFTKLHWDPLAGDKSRIYLDKKFELLPGGHRSRGGASAPTLTQAERQAKEEAGLFVDHAPGAPKIDALSPFELIVDPRARMRGLADAQWAVHRKLMMRDQAMELFPDSRAAIEEADAYTFDSGSVWFLELISQFAAGQEGLYAPNVAEYERNDLVLIDELWGRAGPTFGPQGTRIIRVGKHHLVANEANPYAEAGVELPFVAWRWSPNPGQMYGGGLVQEMMSAQDAYNHDRSRIREQARRHGNPRMLVPRNAGVRETDFSESPNNLIYYNAAGGPPIPVAAPDVPQYAREEITRAEMEIDKVGATSQADQGQAPGSVRGSIGIRMLLDRSDQVRDPIIFQHFMATQELGTQELRLAQAFLKDNRMLTILGQGGEREMLAFSGADLRQNTTLFVTSQPGQRDNQIARVADVDFLLERGVLNPQNPAHQAEILRVMRFRVPNEEYSIELQEEIDEKSVIQQMTENAQYIPEPNPWELEEPRLRAINAYRRKRDLWSSLPQNIQANISARADMFQATLQEKILQQQMLAASLQAGAPAPKGEASQPKSSGAQEAKSA